MTRISTPSHLSAKRVLVLAAATLPLSVGAAAQQPGSQEAAPRPSAQARADWQREMTQVPHPKEGCFTSTYPSREWREVPCVATPSYPQPPRRGPVPETVGDGSDVAAQAPTGFISSATGSFDSVTGVTSESGPIGNSGPSIANAYTLQLNTDMFASTACAGSPNPSCKGWQQFVFENNGSIARAYIQYRLIRYNATCPSGASWNQFSFTGSTDIYCWKNNTAGAVPVPLQPISNLGNLTLTGTVSTTGDSIAVFDGTALHTRTGDNAVAASGGWRIAEFNIFGDGGNSAGGGTATFNTGASIVTRTRINYGGTAPPVCVATGFTAEKNNLSFGPTAPAAVGPGPAVIFDESTTGGAASNCAAATTIGDTHLTTFRGLLYDFQATGDFLLAETSSGFQVQTRQVSGAPTWPNASINKAVAVRAGSSRVAICLPNRVEIDGRPIELRDGGRRELADGGNVIRHGNVYLVRGPAGDSARAVLNGSYIDVSVGLGRWPDKVRGLLAGATNGKVEEIEARDGTVLTAPFAFDALYGRYAEGWRVPARELLLSACGRGVERSVPRQPFFAADLKPDLAERTRAICTRTGVKEGPLLDACTLDVAVIGEQAAKVFVHTHDPVAVGDAPSRRAR